MLAERGIQHEFRQRLEVADFWRVAAHLAAEELIYNRRGKKEALELAYHLCPSEDPVIVAQWRAAQWRAALWSGHVAMHVGRDAIAREDLPSGGSAYLKRIEDRLLAILRGDRLPASDRAEAGRLLGKLGDPRFEVLDPLRIEWVEIPAGTFWMGSGDEDEMARDEERPLHQVDLPYPYQISRFPITNAQYRAFVDAGGYRERRYWREAEAAGVWSEDQVKAYTWNPSIEKAEQQTAGCAWDYGEPFHLPNHPVVGVCWYEALAFARWLSERPAGPGRGLTVTLPSEAEWEKVARGSRDCRRLPWGDPADPERANYDAAHLEATTAVGCFPRGMSPAGVDEMAGNVWQWTRSLWGTDFDSPDFRYPYSPEDGREELGAGETVLRVLRGGSFYNSAEGVRCACRSGGVPDYRHNLVGFRVVASPSTP